MAPGFPSSYEFLWIFLSHGFSLFLSPGSPYRAPPLWGVATGGLPGYGLPEATGQLPAGWLGWLWLGLGSAGFSWDLG